MYDISFYMIILLSYIIGGISGFLTCCLFSISKIDKLHVENDNLKLQTHSGHSLFQRDVSAPEGRADES